ncbi:MAG: peptide deformylase [Galactobacter sp.]|uniref:peptide deformylase n=1 Tax=Galactobacter sp. TaxID=2676125 RepID=UPI0025BFE37B|nr:peptide deformylase [Galactobacter sp.]
MTVLPVRVVGDPVLRTQTDPVTRFDDKLRHLVQDMHQTMEAVNGVGLAAPQIGVSQSLFVYHVGNEAGAVCNPVVSVDPHAGTDTEGSEGCLSVPGLGFHLPRPDSVTVHGQDLDGNPITLTGTGLLARCFQHETDHLSGKLYIDHLTGADRKQAFAAIRSQRFTTHANQVGLERAGNVGSAFGVGAS